MTDKRDKKSIEDWFGEKILPGESKSISLSVSESYSSGMVNIPIHIKRSEKEGPVVFVTAALHGDEINGTGAVRMLIQDPDLKLLRGSLILVPVLNILAFERHSRYLPDRRDLNRCFPGSSSGSLASRMAKILFSEIVSRSDYGIDLHTASIRRTNYPNVRGDLSNPKVSKLAKAFGAEIILNGAGPMGGFRRSACEEGCPTIIMEGGEVWKVEPTIVESAIRGIHNVLKHLGMMEGKYVGPPYQIEIKKSKWIRADFGGFMQFHVVPGDIVEEGQPLATNTTLLGDDQNTLYAPFNGVVIGMTTLPAISPGEPLCNLGKLPSHYKPSVLRKMRASGDGLELRLSDDLASSMLIVEPDEEEE